VFRGLEQRLRETRSVAPTAHVKACRPWAMRTPANEDSLTSAVENSCDFAQALGLSKTGGPRSASRSAAFTLSAHTRFQVIVPYGRNLANGYDCQHIADEPFILT
jgi:hypothetical protein